MEFTQEDFIQYLAHHFGSTVNSELTYEDGETSNYDIVLDAYNLSDIESRMIRGSRRKYWLSLTPLTMITDEDAIEVARIATNKKNIHLTDTCKKGYGFSFWVNNEKEYQINWERNLKLICLEATPYEHLLSNHDVVQCYQYLQSKGYALPYKQYSIDQLLKANVLRLKK